MSNAPANNNDTKLGVDILWGIDRFAQEIGLDSRKVFHLLKTKRLPAKKVGGQWCASKTGLRGFFSPIVDVAA